MVLDFILDPIFGPLLRLPTLWAILIISFSLSLLITLVYKWMTDQTLMKTLKEDIKKFQKEMKEFKEDPKKVMEIQKKAMETNMKYMMHSMKPTLVTFLPLIIIFGWLHAHIAYDPIMPDTQFSVTALFNDEGSGDITLIAPEEITLLSNATQEIKGNKAVWKMKGEAGEHYLEFDYKDRTYSKDVLIDNEDYITPSTNVKENGFKSIEVSNKPVKPLRIFGWEIGWLGTYIIFSIVFSIGLRKLLKLH